MVNSKASKYLTKDFYLHNKVPFLLSGMESAEADLQLLKKWGFEVDDFKKLLEIQEFDDDNTSVKTVKNAFHISNFKIDQTKIKKQFLEFDSFKNRFQKYVQELLEFVLEQHPDVDKKIQDDTFNSIVLSLNLYAQECHSELLVYSQLHADSTLMDYIFQNTLLVSMSGAWAESENNSSLVLASILDKLFFYQNSIEKIKLFLIKNKLSFNSPLFIKKQLNFTIEKLKQNNISEFIRKLILFKYEFIDGSGLLKIKGENIPFAANLLTLVNHYLIENHGFMQSISNNTQKSGTVKIIKAREQFHPQAFNVFIKLIGGLIEIGRVVNLTLKGGEEILAIVMGSIGISRSIVKVIMNKHKQIDYSDDLIEITIGPENKIIPENNEKIIKRVQEIFYKNIMEEQYKI